MLVVCLGLGEFVGLRFKIVAEQLLWLCWELMGGLMSYMAML